MVPDEIKLKIFRGVKVDTIVTYIDMAINLTDFKKAVSSICCFEQNQPFTMKWIDSEADPCVLSTQEELEEMLSLCLNRSDTKQPEVILHVFEGKPMMPGLPCPDEVSRTGAKWWREKTKYLIYGHVYQPKRLKRASCAYCHDNIWGLGKGGFKCLNCKLMVHKKCHKLCKIACNSSPLATQTNNGVPSPLSNKNGVYRNNFAFDSHTNEPTTSRDIAQGNYEQRVDLDLLESTEDGQYRLEDFELLRVIGRGSYAKVLMVELKQTKRIYAMKVIKKEMFINNENEDIDCIQTEKHVFETASNYPFLVGLHSCFQNESRLFFVIEFVRGGDLMYHMQRRRRLQEHEARFYAAEISLALDYLHIRGIIYRDLKLDNVLLDHEGHIKLTDYGMCKEGMRKGEKTSTFCGTPNYISPELLRGEDYDFGADWWALGVLLYEMLAGKSPFETDRDATEEELFRVIVTKTIRLPRNLSAQAIKVLSGFLKKDPAERLGCHPTRGFTDIKLHEFFKSIDWEKLEKRQIDPPYTPQTDSERDLRHFDREFVDMPIQFTPPENPTAMQNLDQSEFIGFSYVNPLLMSVENEV